MATAKKTASAKKAAPKKAAPVKKAAPATKSSASKATKSAAKKAAPAAKSATKSAKSATTAAKKSVPAKPTAAAKKSAAPAKKAAPAKTAGAKSAKPAAAVAPAKKAVPAKTTAGAAGKPVKADSKKKSNDEEVLEVDGEIVEAELEEEEVVDLEEAGALETELEAELAEDLAEVKEEIEAEAEKTETEDEGFTISDVDDTDEPVQTVHQAGATADPVKDYLKQIGKVALLNAELEVELAKQVEAGLFAEELRDLSKQLVATAKKKKIICDICKLAPMTWFVSVPDEDGKLLTCDRCLERVIKKGQRAKDHLLEANLRLVVSLAKRYTGRGMLFLDLIQEGNLGLIRAVEKFDYTKGYKFSTYATWWIRQAITRAMADQARTIRIPVHMVEVINKLARVQRQMLQDLGREPTPEELARELDMTPEKVVEVQKYGREPISLHTPLGEEGDSEFGDLIEDSEAIVPSDAVSFTLLQEQLEGVLDTLSEREAGVVRMRFGLTDGQPKTLDEIGKVYGVTRERIRQIESKTMAKLRHPSRSQVLRDYLD